MRTKVMKIMQKMELSTQRMRKRRRGRKQGEPGQDEASSDWEREQRKQSCLPEKEAFPDGWYEDCVDKERVEAKEDLQGQKHQDAKDKRKK